MHVLPKYLRHSSGQARTVINGKVFYLGKHGSKASKQRYDALLAEWLASNRSPTYGLDSGELLLQDLMLAYARHAKVYYGVEQNSEWHRIKYALKPLAELYSATEVIAFGPLQFKAVRQKMLDQGTLARSSINRMMSLILRSTKDNNAVPVAWRR